MSATCVLLRLDNDLEVALRHMIICQGKQPLLLPRIVGSFTPVLPKKAHPLAEVQGPSIRERYLHLYTNHPCGYAQTTPKDVTHTRLKNEGLVCPNSSVSAFPKLVSYIQPEAQSLNRE